MVLPVAPLRSERAKPSSPAMSAVQSAVARTVKATSWLLPSIEIGCDGSEPSGPTTLSRGVRFRSPPSESHDARNAHTIANMVSSFFIVR